MDMLAVVLHVPEAQAAAAESMSVVITTMTPLVNVCRRSDRLSDVERRQALAVVHRLRNAGPTRPAAQVDAELRELRATRRRSGRRHPSR